MSSIPGHTLEEFLAWNFSIVVEDAPENNFSVGMAEMMGTVARRPVYTQEQFKVIVDLYEPYRESIENMLDDFDEEEQSWRSYSQYVDGNVPAEVSDKAQALLKELEKS